MSTMMVPVNMDDAMKMLGSVMSLEADGDAAAMPAGALAEVLRTLEEADAVEAAACGRFLAAFDAQDGPVATSSATPGPG